MQCVRWAGPRMQMTTIRAGQALLFCLASVPTMGHACAACAWKYAWAMVRSKKEKATENINMSGYWAQRSFLESSQNVTSAYNVAASYKLPMLVTRIRFPVCAFVQAEAIRRIEVSGRSGYRAPCAQFGSATWHPWSTGYDASLTR